MYRPQQRVMRKEICPQCRGSGTVFNNDVWSWGPKPCQACKGKGQIEIPVIPQMRQNPRNMLGI